MAEILFTSVDMHVHRMQGNDLEQSADLNRWRSEFRWDDAKGAVKLHREGIDGIVGTLDFAIDQQACEPNNNLAFDKPISLKVHISETPLAVTSLYLFGDWWTRPAFSQDFRGIPERTQAALIKFMDQYVCLVPMVGREFKAVLDPGGPDWFTLSLTAGRDAQSAVHEPLFAWFDGDTIFDAVGEAFEFLARERNIRMYNERRYPEMFEYLGWCSWNACYRDVNSDILEQKAKELHEKEVPVRWFLIDDGWLTTKDGMLWDYAPDTEKFQSFPDVISVLKRRNNPVKWVGVWRALSGYWAGIHPEGPLARFSKDSLLFANNGRVLPAPETGKAFRFNNEWHRQLKQYGVDFVKVDVQGAVKNHYAGNASMCDASRQLLEALDASTTWFDGAMINCMGMAMEDMLSRPNSAISRNSDDFFPDKEGSFTEHLLQNAYNALYHGQLYWCDWDMFWTSHPDAEKHALLRAISGGPVYCSDRVGETNRDVLRPLAYENGRILRMARPALPMQENVFQNPLESGILSLTNITKRHDGAIAAFNLTVQRQKASFCIFEVPGIAYTERYLIYDWFERRIVTVCDKLARVEVMLKPGEFGLCIAIPMADVVFIGRTDKYMSAAAVEGVQHTRNVWICELAEQGPIRFAATAPVARVSLNDEDVSHLVSIAQEATETQPALYEVSAPVASKAAVVAVELKVQ